VGVERERITRFDTLLSASANAIYKPGADALPDSITINGWFLTQGYILPAICRKLNPVPKLLAIVSGACMRDRPGPEMTRTAHHCKTWDASEPDEDRTWMCHANAKLVTGPALVQAEPYQRSAGGSNVMTAQMKGRRG
jgi:hypothetical protein